MITTTLLNQITLGRTGKNQGYSMGMPKLESIIDGVTGATSTLIFAPSGVGKTSIALYSYIYRPAMEHLTDGKFKVIYYSLEMSADKLFGKLLSMYIFEKYGKELSTKELLSRKRGYVLSDEDYQIVQECKPWLEQLEKVITVYDKNLNAQVLYSTLMKELEQVGSFQEEGKRKVYIPNDPSVITLVIIDHMALLRPSDGRTLKQEIDLASSYLVSLRERCKISPVLIMQANRDASSMDRRKEGMTTMTLNDVKDSGGPVQDSEIVISLFSPFREKLSTYRGYDIKQLESRFRVVSVLKNRYGEGDIEIGCAFYGKPCIFAELPRPDEIYDYGKYETSDWLRDKTEEEDDQIENLDDSNKKTFKFTL